MLPTDDAALTQEAAGNDAAARPVATPEGQPIALIPVAPGQVIELPYRADELSAKLERERQPRDQDRRAHHRAAGLRRR